METFYNHNNLTSSLNNIDIPKLPAKPLESLNKFIIEIIDNNILNKDNLLKFLTSPRIPSNQELASYRSKHLDEYLTLSQELYYDFNSNSMLIHSGMFGGKSTLAHLITNHFKKENFEIINLIPDFMVPNSSGFISLRTLNQQVDAKTYPRDFNSILKSLEESKKYIIHFDECTFLNSDLISDFLREMSTRSNVKIIFTGLNRDYLGINLPAYEILSKNCSKIVECKSYVSGFDSDGNIGTHTIRYIKINDRWLLDFGFARKIIPKECQSVIYLPCPEFIHPSTFINFKDIVLSKEEESQIDTITNLLISSEG